MADFKTYRKNNYKIFKCDYYSLDDFLNTIIKKPINDRIFESPESDKQDNKEWYGTDSFKEAWELCKFTCDEGYRDFSNKVNKINYKIINKLKKVDCYKPVGSSVNVPRYLFGIPDNMRNKEELIISPTIEVYYNVSYSFATKINRIKNRGILTLALIDYLENVKHYKVDLYFFEMSQKEDEITLINIKLKDKDEKLKVKRCYFPIVHPSFLRRLLFRALEIIPNLEAEWNHGYGHPVDYNDARMILDNDTKNSIYISNPNELGIKGNNLDEDMTSFIEIINNKYHVFDEDNPKQKKYLY